MKYFTAYLLASMMTVNVIGTFPDNDNLNSIGTGITAQHAVNITRIPADTETWTLAKLQRHYLAETSPEHPQTLRRQLAEKCTLQRTCMGKKFSECDFSGCSDLTELILTNRGINGSLPAGLRKLTKLSKLCVGVGHV